LRRESQERPATGNIFIANNTVPTTITSFRNPQLGQVIYVIAGDANMSISPAGNIKGVGGGLSLDRA